MYDLNENKAVLETYHKALHPQKPTPDKGSELEKSQKEKQRNRAVKDVSLYSSTLLFICFLEVPGTIRAPRHTFFMNKMYKKFAAGHHKSGHHGHHSLGFACFQQDKYYPQKGIRKPA